MSDLINRQVAIDYIKQQRARRFVACTIEEVMITILEELPAERQEIIRCKDCAAYGTMMHGKDERMICHRFALNFPEDFYCADAERRKDGRPNQQTGGDNGAGRRRQ